MAELVKRYPTRLHLRCSSCQHEGTASLYLDQVKRLRCKVCNSRNIVIVERDGRSQSWSRRRRGAGGTKNWRHG